MPDPFEELGLQPAADSDPFADVGLQPSLEDAVAAGSGVADAPESVVRGRMAADAPSIVDLGGRTQDRPTIGEGREVLMGERVPDRLQVSTPAGDYTAPKVIDQPVKRWDDSVQPAGEGLAGIAAGVRDVAERRPRTRRVEYQAHPLEQPSEEQYTPGEGFVEGVAQVGAMGWLDELAAKLAEREGIPYEQARMSALKVAQDIERQQGQHVLAGNVAGGAAMMALPMGAPARGGVAATRAATAAEGVGLGALAGAGSAEPGERLEGAVEGAALGGGAALLGPGAAGLFRRGAGRLERGAVDSAAIDRLALVNPAGGASKKHLKRMAATYRSPAGTGPAAVAADLESAGVFGEGFLQRALATGDDVARRAEAANRASGEEIGSIVDRASSLADAPGPVSPPRLMRDASGPYRGTPDRVRVGVVDAPPGTVPTDRFLGDVQREVFDPMQFGPRSGGSPAGLNPRNRRITERRAEPMKWLGSMAEEYPDQMSARDLQDVRKALADRIRYNRISDPESIGPDTQALMGIRRTASRNMDRSIEDAGQALGDPSMNERLKRARSTYGATERLLEMAEENAYRDASNRGISPTDYLAGIGGYAAGGPVGAALMSIGNRLFRARENALKATGKELVASGIAGSRKALAPLSAPARRLSARGTGVMMADREQVATPARAVETALKTNPGALGAYADVLRQAASEGPKALSIKHYSLSQMDPGYRQTIRALQGDAADDNTGAAVSDMEGDTTY